MHRCKLKRIKDKISNLRAKPKRFSLALLFNVYKRILFKTVAAILAVTFIALDIAWAYPPEHNDANSTLAVPSGLQQVPIAEHAARFQQSIFSQAELLGSVCSIGKYLLEDNLPIKYLEQVMTAELGKAVGGIDLSRVVVKNDAVLIPCKIKNKKRVVQIALRSNVASKNLIGYEWFVSDRYVVKELPENYGGSWAIMTTSALTVETRVGEKKPTDSPQAPKWNMDELVDLLGAKPYLDSSIIASRLGIDIEELIKLYRRINSQPKLRQFIIRAAKSVNPGFMNELKMVSEDPDRLSKIVKGELVYPMILELHPGKVCPSSCVMCGSVGFKYEGTEKSWPVLTLSRMKELAKEFADNGGRQLWISGGQEPFIHTGTANVVEYAAKEIGLETHVFNNGISLRQDDFDKVLNAAWVRFSINGATKETYKAVHGVDQFDRVISKVKAFVKRRNEIGSKCKIGISFILVPENYKDLVEMAKLANEIGVDFFFAVRFFPDQKNERPGNFKKVRMFTEQEALEIIRMSQELKKLKEDGKFPNMNYATPGMDIETLTGEKLYDIEDAEATTCRARLLKLGVNPFGRTYYCEYAEHPQNARKDLETGNLAVEDLRSVIARSMKKENTYDGDRCPFCLYHERNLNVVLGKLIKDGNDGVCLEDQPLIGTDTAEAREGPKVAISAPVTEISVQGKTFSIKAISRATKLLAVPVITITLSYFFSDFYASLFVVKSFTWKATIAATIIGGITLGAGNYMAQTARGESINWTKTWKWAVVGAILIGPLTYGIWFPYLWRLTQGADILFPLIDLGLYASLVFIPLEFLAQKYFVSKGEPTPGFWSAVKSSLRVSGLNFVWFFPIQLIGLAVKSDCIVLFDANAGIIWAGILVYLLESWKMLADRKQVETKKPAIAAVADGMTEEHKNTEIKQITLDPEFHGNEFMPPPVAENKATQLFNLVESVLNNERVKFIETGNKINASLDKDMTVTEIREKVERAISIIEVLEQEKVSAETKAAIESLKKNFAQFEADGGVASLIILARRAARENQKLIIGLETDWIPGLSVKSSLQKQALSALMKEIDEIAGALRSMGLDNIEIIHGSGGDLAGLLTKAAKDSNANMHNIVVMASVNTINSASFEPLRNAPENDRPFLAGIDPTELIRFYEEFGEATTKQLYIRLTSLLYTSLELAAGKEPPQLQIIVSYDKKMRIVIFLPRAEPKDYEILKNTYAAEKTALQAA
ncbi:MAG: radical SAM protein [Candidatus Omnitrophota bacterium]|nr:radical SAM protein [Candidatus Omnitrophota bacterium]